METGTVCRICADKGYGFIRAAGVDYFFHVKDLVDDLTFDEQLHERRVQFNVVSSPRGFRAVEVRPAD